MQEAWLFGERPGGVCVSARTPADCLEEMLSYRVGKGQLTSVNGKGHLWVLILGGRQPLSAQWLPSFSHQCCSLRRINSLRILYFRSILAWVVAAELSCEGRLLGWKEH